MCFGIEIGTIEQLLRVDAQIPEFDGRTTRQKVESRLLGKQSLILIASIDAQPVAYKIGYSLTEQVFYSWLGGVIPAYRKQGLASKLREWQECWAAQHGYRHLNVKSMNRYPAMLKLLISSGYQISGYEDNGTSEVSKICFTKPLTDIKSLATRVS